MLYANPGLQTPNTLSRCLIGQIPTSRHQTPPPGVCIRGTRHSDTRNAPSGVRSAAKQKNPPKTHTYPTFCYICMT